MKALIARVRAAWDRTDTVLFGSNLVAFLVFYGNCWWGAPAVAYAALLGPLAVQVAWALRQPGPLRQALAAGALLGAAWPLGEWLVVETFGWWGVYRAPGWAVLHTPVYCMLIGWQATAYCVYFGRRIEDLGYARRTAALHVGLTAFFLGIIGENFFVANGMWAYDPAAYNLWGIPAFLPVAYGLGYAPLPYALRWGTVSGTAAFAAWLFTCCIALGLATGFFPR